MYMCAVRPVTMAGDILVFFSHGRSTEIPWLLILQFKQ